MIKMKKKYIQPTLLTEIVKVETMLIGISDGEYNGEFDAKELFEFDEDFENKADENKMSLW